MPDWVRWRCAAGCTSESHSVRAKSTSAATQNHMRAIAHEGPHLKCRRHAPQRFQKLPSEMEPSANL
eukprot:4345156-Pyramimonas_sp.AAC.1